MLELEVRRPSKAWYLLSLTIPVIGGVIMMFALLSRDGKMARKGLVISGSWIAIIISTLMLIPSDISTDVAPTDPNVSIGTPSNPLNLKLSAPDFGHIRVSWSTPSNSGDSPVTGYVVQYRKANEEWKNIEVGSNTFSTDITGLSSGTYLVRVLAKNNVGLGEPSIRSEITLA